MNTYNRIRSWAINPMNYSWTPDTTFGRWELALDLCINADESILFHGTPADLRRMLREALAAIEISAGPENP